MGTKQLPDFDAMLVMAENPQALEQYLRQEVDNVIDSAPVEIQPRLRGLQFQIDAQRQIHKSAMGACIKISEMMHQSFARLRYLLREATGQPNHGLVVIEDTPETPAEIITFRARR